MNHDRHDGFPDALADLVGVLFYGIDPVEVFVALLALFIP